MKRIIRNKPEELTIDLSEITNDSIVGVQWNNRSTPKGMLVPFYNGFSYIASLNDCTIGKWRAESKREYVKDLYHACEGTAYIFDSLVELAKWMQE